MDYIEVTWIKWFSVAAFLLASYLLLRFIGRRLSKVDFFGKRQEVIQRIIHSILLIYEPVALIVLCVGFVFINPLYHGLALGLLLLAGFGQVRNYLNGRIVLFDKNLKPGSKITAGEIKGVVSEMIRLGMRVQNSRGLHYINYSQLLKNGYLLHSGEEVGGYYQLKLSAQKENNSSFSHEKIIDLFASAPYLDWGTKPDLIFPQKKTGEIKARVSVKEESHLQDLTLLIEEWGFETEIIKK